MASLEASVAARSHVIARTFERVCAVLERLGYLADGQVTPDGRRLGDLYTELDLLAAECLRRGLWDGLDPAELAACVSVADVRVPAERRRRPGPDAGRPGAGRGRVDGVGLG